MCQICTGCGRCRGAYADIHVLSGVSFGLTPEGLYGEKAGAFPEGADYLVAADVGTTTVAMALIDREGREADRFAALNPQSEYGRDVLSRIEAARSPKAAGRMQRGVRAVLESGIAGFREKVGEGKRLTMTLAANTVMTYLLMGYNPAGLGQAPFLVSRREELHTRIGDVPCRILPSISAFVGGDITAGMIAAGMFAGEELTLLVDLGTNGEMALGRRERLLVCSTAAGPAFEGGATRGVWGADAVHLLAVLRKRGAVDETGLLAAEFFEEGVLVEGVRITKEAVRALQLAKGAILAGIRILLGEFGVTQEQVDRVVLAGGFGYYLNPADAAAIGLLPAELAGKAVGGGNTALAGAALWGAYPSKVLLGEDWRSRVESISLAQNADFQKIYMDSLNLQEFHEKQKFV